MCFEECDTCEASISQIGDCGHIIQGKCGDIDMKCQIKVYFLCCYITFEIIIIN